VYLTGPPAPADRPPSAAIASEAERDWALIKDSKAQSDFEAFRLQYGKANSFYRQLAEKRIEELKKEAAQAKAQAEAEANRQRNERIVAERKAAENAKREVDEAAAKKRAEKAAEAKAQAEAEAQAKRQREESIAAEKRAAEEAKQLVEARMRAERQAAAIAPPVQVPDAEMGAQCITKAGRGTAQSEDGAKFQAWEAVLQATDWGSWAAFMAFVKAGGKMLTAPGYKVSDVTSRCKPGDLGHICVIQARLCKSR
jgi:colicin import membrane protein